LLTLDIFQYLLRKIDPRPVKLTNLVSFDSDHAQTKRSSIPDPRVSIIIPTRDKPELLRACVASILEKTDYSDIELVIVNNGSVEAETKELLSDYQREGHKVIDYPGKFNYSKICNVASAEASGDFLCFLNNDTEVKSSNWLRKMVDHASKENVALVGAVLSYPNDTIQHMGISLGYTGVAGHPYRNIPASQCVPKSCFEVSAVTFACAVIAAEKFHTIGGLDEAFPAGFNDVDISIRAKELNLRNVVCIHAELMHRESQSRAKSLSPAGAIQATKAVLAIVRKHRSGFRERFFSR